MVFPLGHIYGFIKGLASVSKLNWNERFQMSYCFWKCLAWFQMGFLSLGPAATLGRMTLCWDCPGHCRLLSSIPGSHPGDASSAPCSQWGPQNASRHWHVSPGHTVTPPFPIESYWFNVPHFRQNSHCFTFIFEMLIFPFNLKNILLTFYIEKGRGRES